MGGVFYMKGGTVLLHVQQNCTTPVNTQADNKKWLMYEEMSAPMALEHL